MENYCLKFDFEYKNVPGCDPGHVVDAKVHGDKYLMLDDEGSSALSCERGDPVLRKGQSLEHLVTTFRTLRRSERYDALFSGVEKSWKFPRNRMLGTCFNSV